MNHVWCSTKPHGPNANWKSQSSKTRPAADIRRASPPQSRSPFPRKGRPGMGCKNMAKVCSLPGKLSSLSACHWCLATPRQRERSHQCCPGTFILQVPVPFAWAPWPLFTQSLQAVATLLRRGPSRAGSGRSCRVWPHQTLNC